MKVIEIENIDDCIEAEKVFDIHLDSEIDDDFVMFCGKLGKLIYRKDFAKPYFKVLIKGKFAFKGSLSNTLIRVLFPNEIDEKSELMFLKKYLEKY